ncbi:hypothetical protein P43SY_006909 [Pythium insidiosum]|uniref:Conserved oligomeric Golgi complex subunit 4 n=1 Tax=Pythium insidiosum TaxID=114742 RepID=A0AAD5Q605_PYTIN|nr:hypothetical protein P43SY_006909 [Pythium insidiosum]
MLARLQDVKQQRLALREDVQTFLRDREAPEKTAAQQSLRALGGLSTDVSQLCAQTGAVVERVANANDVAAKMTKEVRRLDIIQSRLTATLAQSSHLLSLRHALTGIRRAMQLRNYLEAAKFLQQLKDIETLMPLDVADRVRVDAIELELKEIIEDAFGRGLRDGDRALVTQYAPLFQIVGPDYEERGAQLLLDHLRDSLAAELAGVTHGSFSTKELMEHLATIFNRIAVVAQENDSIASQCFARVNGVNRLVKMLYLLGESAAVGVLTAYMKQRQFRERMSAEKEESDSAAPRAALPSQTEDEIAHLNAQLNEIALLIQHTQTYERFMQSRVVPSTADSGDAVLPSSQESELGKTVQELAGFYCFFENDLLTRAARKAFQWEELRLATSADAGGVAAAAVVPISSAIDEIFYVARNSGLRALATGHVDCAASVLNMINTVLRDSLGDTMRSRIRNMAAHVKLDTSAGLLGVTSAQLRDQMQQQFAKLSKTMGPIPIAGAASGVVAVPTPETQRKELGPDVVMNSLEVTGTYIAQLKDEFEAELAQDFPDEVPTYLQTCLLGLEDAAAELTQLLEASRKKLCKVLEPRVASLLAPLIATGTKRATVSYELTEQMFTFNEANDPFAVQFVVAMRDSMLAAFRETLSATNLDALVDALAGCTAELLERWFYGRHVRFTQLGALQFDKDLRVLASFFGEHSPASRERFATLTQIAMVLNVDSPSDVTDFVGRRSRGGVAWRLSGAQVKEVLARRVDFADAAINQLVLPAVASAM